MIERIKKVMEDKGYNVASFSEKIGVNRSNFNHYYSGRSQPGLDIVMKIVAQFPDISLDWLLLGDGTMYRTRKEPEDHPLQLIIPPTGVREPIDSSLRGYHPQLSMFDNNESASDLPMTNDDTSQQSVIEPSIQSTQAFSNPIQEQQIEQKSKIFISDFQTIDSVTQMVSPEPIRKTDAPKLPSQPISEPLTNIKDSSNNEVNCAENKANAAVNTSIASAKTLSKIIFFYTDHTFEIFVP